MKSDNQLNVLFSSDDNYSQHLGAAVFSLLDRNRQLDSIEVYIVDGGITDKNKEKLQVIINNFSNAEIQWIDFEKWKNQLDLNMAWSISLSSYARLFVAEMLPENVNRVLYLDCDMIICDSLSELWSVDLNRCVLGAVQDTVGTSTKTSIGLKSNDCYFNSGMLLINLDKWRKEHIGEKCLDFIRKHNGNVLHHDQGVLNGVLNNRWYKLPLKHNMMTIHYVFTKEQIEKYYCDKSVFYGEQEIAEAKQKPVILHYTPSFTTRPWVKNCRHPLKDLYWESLKHTPWSMSKLSKDKSKWYIKLQNWRYRNLPY